MTVRPDNRLADAPMQPVDCRACGACVLVRKSSWEQTSVQWNAPARQRCTQTLETDGHTDERRTPVPSFVRGCPELRDAIEAAVRHGALPVLDESSTNGQ